MKGIQLSPPQSPHQPQPYPYQPQQYQARAVPQSNGLAVASMVLGILSIFTWWGFGGIVMAILAIVFAARDSKQRH